MCALFYTGKQREIRISPANQRLTLPPVVWIIHEVTTETTFVGAQQEMIGQSLEKQKVWSNFGKAHRTPLEITKISETETRINLNLKIILGRGMPCFVLIFLVPMYNSIGVRVSAWSRLLLASKRCRNMSIFSICQTLFFILFFHLHQAEYQIFKK